MTGKRFLEILKKACEPPRILAWLVCFASFGLLFYVFYDDAAPEFLHYIAYVASAYALIVAVFGTIRLIKSAKTGFEDSKVVTSFKNTAFWKRYNDDVAFKSNVLLLEGTVVNIAYMAFKLITGIAYSSVWSITIAGYYLLLVVIKGLLFVVSMRAAKREDGELFLTKRAIFLSVLLFLVNIPAIGIVCQVVFLNSSYIYPSYVIYLSAAHTFYTFTKAIINIIKYRKVGKISITFSKVINVDTALMSLFALQTAMITTFSQNDEYFRLLMNTLTGVGVVVLIAFSSVFMLYFSSRKRRLLLKKENFFE